MRHIITHLLAIPTSLAQATDNIATQDRELTHCHALLQPSMVALLSNSPAFAVVPNYRAAIAAYDGDFKAGLRRPEHKDAAVLEKDMDRA
tara:strand:+ start:44401 stop:44670 length:270 start_codon:yes stop_codon:yes gene_type:complete